LAEAEEQRRRREEENARRRQLAKEQKLGGAPAEDAMEDEEFEQFDAEGDELLADDSSEDEDSMQVVCSPAVSRCANVLRPTRTTT
jgi:nuclear GTP-binding protein